MLAREGRVAERANVGRVSSLMPVPAVMPDRTLAPFSDAERRCGGSRCWVARCVGGGDSSTQRVLLQESVVGCSSGVVHLIKTQLRMPVAQSQDPFQSRA